MKYTKLMYLMLAVLIAPRAYSTELTLSDSLKVAEDSSPDVRKARAAKEEASWKKTEAFSIFLPKLDVTGSHLMSNKFMVENVSLPGTPGIIPFELISPYTIWTARAEWMFFDGFANYDQYKAMSYGASAADKEADWARFQVQQETKLKFYKAIAAVELEKVANQNVTTLQEHLGRAKALRQSGAGTNFDVLRVEVQLNEAQSEMLNTQDITILSKQSFLNDLGLEDQTQTLKGDLPVPDAGKVVSIQKPSTVDRLDFQAIQDREMSAHKSHLAAYKHWIPKFSLFAESDYYNNTSRGINEQDYRDAYSFGIAMSWNLFDGFASTARAAEADARQVQATETTRKASLKNSYDFDFWKRRYIYSASLYKAKLVDVEKAQESVRLATQSFRAGTRTSSEVLDAELDLFRARAGVVNAQVNAAEALVNLELALGKEL